MYCNLLRLLEQIEKIAHKDGDIERSSDGDSD